MTIFPNEQEKLQRLDWTRTARVIFYWLLRGFTFSIAVLLGLSILTAYVWIPFYAAEGYTPQFEDRILTLIGDFLLFISIVIPYRWTVRWPSYLVRVAIIVLAVSWIVVVDIVAYKRGLSIIVFTPHGYIALLVAAALLVTLTIQLKKRRITKPCS
jgi:hypothetical protein